MIERVKRLEIWLWRLKALSFKWIVEERIPGGDDTDTHLLARAYNLDDYRKQIKEDRSEKKLSLEAS